jgi:LuxR family transcriptional regulator, maltose regulon positive regulatory protein
MPSWLLRSRVTPPRHLERLIARRRLYEILMHVQSGQIVSVCAPPGFGKSVLLTSWHSAVLAAGRPAVWLGIDDADDPAVATQYLAFACHHAGIDVTRTGLLTLDSLSVPPPLALQSLLASIEQTGTSTLLVIEDAERASESVIREVFGPLTRFLPANLTIAFASRDPDILDLSDLEQRGLVVRIDAHALRFNREEVRELWGRTATESQVRSVEQRSGGWPALLQLMLQQGSTLQFDAAATPARGAAAVAAFFETRLLARLDLRTRRALLPLTLLDQFSLSIAFELTGDNEIETALNRLLAVGIIARSTSEDGVGYTIHPLLRTYLAARYAAEQPQAARACHVDASRIFLRIGDPVLAVKHAVATDDVEFLGDLVEAIDPLLLGIREGFPRLRQIVRLIPERLAHLRPRIGYACVASAIKAGRLRDAKSLFEALEGVVAKELSATPSACIVGVERAFCQSLLAVYKGTPIHEDDIVALDASLAGTPALAPIVRSLAETLRSFIQAQAGRFGDAKASAWRAIQHANEADSPYAAFFMYCDLAMITGVEGDPASAMKLFDRGVEKCSETVRFDERLTFIRDAFRIELEHEIAPLSSQRNARLKNICVRLPTLEGWLDVYAAAFRTYSEQLYLSGDLPAALAILSAGIDHLREQEIEGIPWALVAQRALLLALSGSVNVARAEFDKLPEAERNPKSRADQPWRLAEAITEALAVISLAAGEDSASLELEYAIGRAQATGNVRSEIRYRRLRAEMLASAGGEAAAGQELDVIGTLEARSGFRRAAILYGDTRNSVPGMGVAEGKVVRLPVGLRREFFSDRELHVIARLERGLSDKSIAMELGITAHGVRYHLKRIYAKLHVRDREEARLKVGRLGLM